MFAPLAVLNEWSNGINFIFAFMIGIGFGFTLERAGFGNSRLLAMQFYFRDLSVFKVMFTAIITAMTGIIFLNAFGWLNIDEIYINPTYMWPGIAGGLIMGVGFAVGGYCPGTSIVGLATFKTDSLYYILGCLTGVFAFGEIAPFIDLYFSGAKSGFMGRITLYHFFNLSAGLIAFIIILIAMGGFWGSEWLERKFSKSRV